MAQTSEELKQEISQTREQMADTADALAHKADVPTRTKDWVGEKKDAIVSAVGGATSAVSEATPDGADVAQSASRLKHLAERNPLGLAIGGAAVGFLAGLLTPPTRIEDQRIGPMADRYRRPNPTAPRSCPSFISLTCRNTLPESMKPTAPTPPRTGTRSSAFSTISP